MAEVCGTCDGRGCPACRAETVEEAAARINEQYEEQGNWLWSNCYSDMRKLFPYNDPNSIVRALIDARKRYHERWAGYQLQSIRPTQEAVSAFDASKDGKLYRRITGMCMWDNLGASSLPTEADLKE